MNTLLVITIVSVRPYLYEIPHILALEDKAVFKFRFRTHWIPPEDQATLHDLESRADSSYQCLIMYRHEHSGDFIPVRHCMLTKVTTIGEVFYLQVRLGPIPQIEQDRDARDRQFQDIRNRHVASLGPGYPNTPGAALRKLVFFTSNDFLSVFHDNTFQGATANREFSAWDTLFQRFSTLQEFVGIDFFKMIGIFKGHDRVPLESVNMSHAYKLLGGTPYSVRLYQRRPSAVSTTPPTTAETDVSGVYPVRLKADPKAITVLSETAMVVGRYDILEFLCRPLPEAAGEHTVMLLELGLDNTYHPQALRYFGLNIAITLPAYDRIVTVAFAVVLVSVLFREALASRFGIGADTLLNIQTFLLFILGVGTRAVQRVAQSLMSKTFHL